MVSCPSLGIGAKGDLPLETAQLEGWRKVDKGSRALGRAETPGSGLEGHQDGNWRPQAHPLSQRSYGQRPATLSSLSCSALFPVFTGMLKPAIPKELQDLGRPEDPRWLRVHSGRTGKAISGESGLGTPPGGDADCPEQGCGPQHGAADPPSSAMTTPVRGCEPHSSPEKAAVPTRWQAEPSIPTQATTAGRKTQPGRNNPHPAASLCFCTPPSSGTPISPVSLPGEPSSGPHLLPSRSKGIEHSENLVVPGFSCPFKKRSSPAHTHTADADPRRLFLEVGGLPQHHSVLWPFPPCHGALQLPQN